MHRILHLQGIGDFSQTYYWSSSPLMGYLQGVNFNQKPIKGFDMDRILLYYDHKHSVRAIRAFSLNKDKKLAVRAIRSF